MNRRTAIGRIAAGGIAGLGIFSGYKWYEGYQSPDIAYIEQQKETIAALAETIIPSGHTPGATEAGAADFIIVMVRDCTDTRTANKFIDGLRSLEKYCRSRYGSAFEACPPAEKNATLRYFEQEGRPFPGILGKAQSKYLGKSFFVTLKQYTVEGYCTSQAGATRGLAYIPIPGSYHGCIPLQPGQRGWATK